MSSQNNYKSLWEIPAIDIHGKHYKKIGDIFSKSSVPKVTMIVNVASRCGHTSRHYTEMNELYNKYHKGGFEILAFPCNQFGS